jgi:ribosomal subunit interface protein
MLKKFEIQGVHITVDDDLRKHVTNKIGGLDRYISRHSLESAHAEVFLKESKIKDDHHCTCEVTLFLPHQTIVVKESAKTMYTAVDMARDRVKQQLQVYKDKHDGRLRRHLIARFRRKTR